MNVLPKEYAAWETLCTWLEEQPYNASYRLLAGTGWLLSTTKDTPAYKYGRAAYEQAKRNDAIRHAYALVYWASGYGWRLRKDYRQELERMKQHIITLE